MKKTLLIGFIFLILTQTVVFSAEEKKNSSSPWNDNSSVFNKGFENQEAVTDTKLHKTLEMLKQRALTKKQKKIQKEVKPLSPASDFDHLKEFAQAQDPDDELSQTLTVTIPMSAYSIEGKTIPPGYYKLSCRKISNNEYVLDLSQGTQRVLTVKAQQTQQDLNQDTIQFCNAEIIDDNRIRLMYGSIDLNLVGYIYFK